MNNNSLTIKTPVKDLRPLGLKVTCDVRIELSPLASLKVGTTSVATSFPRD